MCELIKKYNISNNFYRRYFKQNALNRFGMESLKFMWFKEGRFLNPLKKEQILQEYIKEEIENFYEKNEINIPQIEFAITTKCSLKCKDCNALIPRFNDYTHIDMSVDEFKLNLDKLLAVVNSIRHFVVLGGEPFIHKNIDEMFEYALSQDKIFMLRIITNGTIVPNSKTLDVLKKYNKKVYVYISNYSVNEKLIPILKHEEIKKLLKDIDVRYQLVDNWEWFCENGFNKEEFSKEHVEKNFENCFRTQCVQLLNSRIDICSKASTVREIGLLELNDYIDLNKSINLKQDLINFYQKPYQDACKYCILSTKEVKPALQEI